MPSPSEIYSGLIGRGFSPVQAAALAGNIQQESGFNPAALNVGEGANGLIQWRGPRWTALQAFAKERGASPSDVETQLDFIGHEMRGSEVRAGTPFMATTDLPSANAALRKYIRYGDDSEAQRLAYATKFLGDSPPVAPATPTAPARAPAAQPMPAYGWSPNNAPAATAESPLNPLPQQAGFLEPPALQPIAGPPRRPPDTTQLQAFLQRARTPAGFRFLRG